MELHNLQELLERGILNEEKLLEELEMSKRQEILSKHHYAIWFYEKEGFWYTFLPDPTKPNNRRKIKKKKKEDLEQAIYDFYSRNSDRPTVNDMFTLWLEDKKNNITPQTVMKYNNVFKKYIQPIRNGRQNR